MANPNPTALTAAFPAPPPFYKSFTPQNLDRLHDLEPSNPEDSNPQPPTKESSQKPALDLTSLPPELRCLIPPPPPPEGKYRSFGELHDVSPSNPPSPHHTVLLTPTPPLQLHPPTTTPAPTPSPTNLLNLTRRILLTFLALTDRLATTPAAWAPKWDELHALFLEAHGVINEYRPHQARETLILMMEEQVERCREEGRRGREGAENVRRVLGELGAVMDGKAEGGWKELLEEEGEERERKETGEERRVWEVVNREVGRG